MSARYFPSPVMLRSLPLLFVVAATVIPLTGAAQSLAKPKFTGAESCSTSGCHGGGTGNNQFYTWQKKDFHSRAHAILTTTRSVRMAESLKIEDPAKSARCNVCHSPLEALPRDRFVAKAKIDKGVSCESCHGPAEPYLRYHTRPDLTFEQRIAGGLRDLKGFYSRANACVACHLNIDAELVKAGHPEMFFELDGQCAAQPPHWTDEGSWLGPQRWLTGQAVALRELSWKLAAKREPDLLSRWKATGWLLRRTDLGARLLPESEDFGVVQRAADQLARTASREPWTKESTMKALRTYSGLANEFRDSPLDPQELRRRAELVVLAIDRAWKALQAEAKITSPNLDTALALLSEQARQQAAFERAKFAAALQQIEVAVELMGK